MAVRQHAPLRLAGLQVDVVRAMERKRKREDYMRLGEREQQFQIPVSGIAYDIPVTRRVRLNFDLVFVPAKGQRDSHFDHPHVSTGCHLNTGTGDLAQPALMHAVVSDWQYNDKGDIVAADVLITAHFPLAAQGVQFNGNVHITFQGYGAPGDTDFDLGDT